jgi:ATP-binding protein involved in chromosome partitioning
MSDTLKDVGHIIAVASGKGGVGKSTTAANLALALRDQGCRVGLLDADVYGPSQALMFGVPDGERPRVASNCFVPIEAHGIVLMSMAFLVDEQTPMVWRGPMASGALMQMLEQTLWGALDYLIIDMPPGTGDIQLTLAQKSMVTGAVIVTTPQKLSTLDAVRGIEMFAKVNIPVLGVFENMAWHRCPNCETEVPVFGKGGGAEVAEKYQTVLLASMPLSEAIGVQSDMGRPYLTQADSDDPVVARYHTAARTLMERVSMLDAAAPEIEISED